MGYFEWVGVFVSACVSCWGQKKNTITEASSATKQKQVEMKYSEQRMLAYLQTQHAEAFSTWVQYSSDLFIYLFNAHTSAKTRNSYNPVREGSPWVIHYPFRKWSLSPFSRPLQVLYPHSHHHLSIHCHLTHSHTHPNIPLLITGTSWPSQYPSFLATVIIC